MKAVVVGVEETEEGRDALHFARLICDGTGAELHVTSVHSDVLFYDGLDEIAAARERYLDRMLELAETELDGDFEFHRMVETSVPSGLTKVAEDVDADLLVIGSSHRGPIGRILMGDAGARLAAGAPCAVAMVPRGWQRNERTEIAKVGIGFNGTKDAEGALAFGAGLARRLGSSVELIGVIPRIIAPSRVGPGNAGYEKLLREEMDETIKDAIAASEIPEAEGKVRAGYAADELADESSALDLLILGSRSYGPVRRVLLGGASFKVMRSAACPVIVVPRAGN